MRVEYPGAIYHVMDRGDRREDIFLDDVDRQEFLKTLAEGSQKAGWQVHAYCLMRNHFHLVLETPDANLVAGMRWFLSAYTIRLNHRQKLFGHVFSGRYKALLVEGSGNGYLPIKWIAAPLQMGTTKSALSMLHRWMQLQEKSPCTQLQFQPMADPFSLFGGRIGTTRPPEATFAKLARAQSLIHCEQYIDAMYQGASRTGDG